MSTHISGQQRIWYADPFVLLRKGELASVWVSRDEPVERNLNSLVRLALYVCGGWYALTLGATPVYIFLAVCALTVAYYTVVAANRESGRAVEDALREGFDSPEYYAAVQASGAVTAPTAQNPLMNVLPTEHQTNPDRPAAAKSHTVPVAADVDAKVKSTIDPTLFRNIGDEMQFNHFMRSFHTMPSTTIPNDQEAFAQFCYGGMESCKEGAIAQCEKNNFRHILR